MAEAPWDGRREKIGLEKLTRMGAKAVDPIVKFHRNYRWRPWHRKLKTAELALECIAKVRDRAALPRLGELAKDRDRALSLCAVYAIRAMATPQDVGDIIQLMYDDEFLWQARLGQTLGNLDDREARDVLARSLRDERVRFRRAALIGIKALGDPSFVPEVRQAFQREETPRLRIAAAEALASLGDDRGGRYLASVLESDSPAYLLVTAAYAAGRARERRAVPGLTNLLRHKESYFRHVAREALTLIGTDDAMKAIQEHLPKEERDRPLFTERNWYYTFDRDPFMDWDWELEN